MPGPSRIRARLGAAVIMVAGCILIFGAVLLMNKPVPPPKKKAASSITAMQVEKKKKPPARKRPQKQPRRIKSKQAPRAPLPDLSSSLSAANLGIPSLDVGSMMGLAQNAVGAQSAKNLVMTEDSVDVSPRPLRRSSPAYPARARAKNIEGHVTLRVLIGTSGQVEKIKIEDSSPSGVFDESAMQAVRGWQFEPALYRGEKVRVWAKQTVRFNLG
jgi:periplasmic protein TonB